jgi:hypothetical protein
MTRRIPLLIAALCSLAAAADFPLRVSANHRYLEDRNGRPFLVQGEAAWSLVTGVTKQEAERYLDDRRRKGFNAIIVTPSDERRATSGANMAP